jgi:hypothetical protein
MGIMTEDEWLTCNHPPTMVEFLHSRASDRKFRLFACGWARLNWTKEGAVRRQHAVHVAELYADGRASDEDLLAVYEGVQSAELTPGSASGAAAFICLDIPDVPMSAEERRAFIIDTVVTGAIRFPKDTWQQNLRRCQLLRDIFGNPFHPITFDPSCYAAKRIAIAQSIYDYHNFGHLPILADALEDAGCDNADILNHCRQPGEHVRGCWVVDLVLGKS